MRQFTYSTCTVAHDKLAIAGATFYKMGSLKNLDSQQTRKGHFRYLGI